MTPQSNPRKSASVPSWHTITYLGSAECETCGWYAKTGSAPNGRRQAIEHARRHPGHRVRVETGKTTIYGESSPGVLG